MCVHTQSCLIPLRLNRLQPARFLCPWNFPGKNTGTGCHFLFQGTFPTQGLNPCLLCLLHWQGGSLHQHHLGSSIQQAINCINGSEMASLLPNLAFSLPPLVCHLSSGCQCLQEIYVYVCSQGTSSKNVVTMNMHKLPNFFMQNVA